MRQLVLIASLCLLSWLGMMLVHELGHVFGAWLTGGEVERVVLHPFAISRTDVQPNPRPLLVAWLGPIFGAAAPLLLAILGRSLRLRITWILQFFAGFCLIANGAYLGFGSWDRVGDAGDLLRHGAPFLSLIGFAILTLPIGFLLLHWASPELGFGPAPRLASRQDTAKIAWIAVAAAILSFALGRG